MACLAETGGVLVLVGRDFGGCTVPFEGVLDDGTLGEAVLGVEGSIMRLFGVTLAGGSGFFVVTEDMIYDGDGLKR